MKRSINYCRDVAGLVTAIDKDVHEFARKRIAHAGRAGTLGIELGSSGAPEAGKPGDESSEVGRLSTTEWGYNGRGEQARE